MYHYLDYNASSPLRPGVFDAMVPWLAEQHANAHSVHRPGRLARQAVEQARQTIAGCLGAEPDEVIFTSGATEANNWALSGLRAGQPRLVGSTEHDAVLQAVPGAPRVPVLASGVVDAAALGEALSAGSPGLLSLMWANNETGVLNDIPALASLAHERGWWLHSDATQAVARQTIRFRDSGLVAMSCSAHKLGGPKGVGALLLRKGTPIQAWQRGGGHEGGLRSGTLNVPGIVGFATALAHLSEHLPEESERTRVMRDGFESRLLAELPGSRVFAAEAPRMPNTSFFALPGFHSEALLMALDKQGFALASGSACHSGSDVPSHVLAGMGVDTEVALGAVRLSLGHATVAAELDGLLAALKDIHGTAGSGSGLAASLGA